MRLLRNLARRRLRTGLTITGITIGIWALVVFSAMANRIDAVVAGGADAFAGRILVLDATTDGTVSFAPMSVAVAGQVAGVAGVARAAPQVTLTLESEGMGMSLGDTGMITAGPPLDGPGGRVAVRAAAGRLLTAEDSDPVVVLGADLARRAGVAVGATMAIRGVSLAVERGEIVALMGPSGSGKSTLMHLLGLLHTPDREGGPAPVLRIGDRDAAAMSDGERTRMRARDMGFVFQSYNLVPTLTAIENVALAAEYAGARRRDALRSAGAALERVGLSERGRHRPNELSGGEQQRVAIARSLINEPALLLADEPTGNLDSARTQEILALFRDLNRAQGQTVVLVTHDAEVGAVADRIVRMRDGLVVGDEPVIGELAAAA